VASTQHGGTCYKAGGGTHLLTAASLIGRSDAKCQKATQPPYFTCSRDELLGWRRSGQGGAEVVSTVDVREVTP